MCGIPGGGHTWSLFILTILCVWKMGEINKWPQGKVEINILLTLEFEINIIKLLGINISSLSCCGKIKLSIFNLLCEIKTNGQAKIPPHPPPSS